MRHKGSYVKESLSAIYLANRDGEEDVGGKIHKRSEYAYPNEILRMENKRWSWLDGSRAFLLQYQASLGDGEERNSKGHIQKKAR